MARACTFFSPEEEEHQIGHVHLDSNVLAHCATRKVTRITEAKCWYFGIRFFLYSQAMLMCTHFLQLKQTWHNFLKLEK